MSLRSKRLTILLDSEIHDLFGPPKLTIEEKRLYFSLNDPEMEVFHSIRDRYSRIYFVLLLGYFKVKPVVLNFGYAEISDDLRFIANEFYPDIKIKRHNLTRSQRSRLYKRTLELVNYRSYDKKCLPALTEHSTKTASASIEARYLFDDCIDYLAQNHIAIPKYYVLQQIISTTIHAERDRVSQILKKSITKPLAASLDNMLGSEAPSTLTVIRNSAKSFSTTELEKELKAHRHIKLFINDIDDLIQQLNLSLSNLNHYASMVGYYTATKLRRFDQATRYLYLVCYLHVRYCQVIEHMADAFVYHCRKLRNSAKAYAKDAAYRDWHDAAANVGKAAELLRFFIDESIDESVPFGMIRQQAANLICSNDIESLCLYLSDQKRSLEYYAWEYYDQQRELIEKTLRPIFLSLEFQPSETTHALGVQIKQSQSDLVTHGIINVVDRRLIKPCHQPFISEAESINHSRYEVLLYLLIQSKLDGHLYIPRSLKYRCLSDDLVGDAESLPWFPFNASHKVTGSQ